MMNSDGIDLKELDDMELLKWIIEEVIREEETRAENENLKLKLKMAEGRNKKGK